MDEFVGKAAGIGLPIVVLLITMSTTGLAGAAAITASLAFLGPGGMIGGIILLSIVGLAADMLTRFGLDVLLVAIYKERCAKGETTETLMGEIDWLPLSNDLKLKLREAITY
ncbi:hypothetical protein PN498_14870 [Oscillatoria sp. CS-180]|uniref:hypothetical protein n=1 Tax=Oscillatoria sp. CS-180 TaxID=3021720 RepID=UPI00232F1C0C|nr:hypothetical protein [Oscillatoria sp. CS-180]MDB9527280.1 hypothetical protein [Oscillatoria sp. CS-180]